MAKSEKFITSHASRVKRAKDYAETKSPIEVGFFDREAVVEFYLLEDIVRLYRYLLEMERKRTYNTEVGRMAHEDIMIKYGILIDAYNSAAEVTSVLIKSGNFTPVWKAIPEGQLMRVAGKTKYMEQMCDMAMDLIRSLSKDSMRARSIIEQFNEKTKELKDTQNNWAALRGIDWGYQGEDASISEVSPVSDSAPEINPMDRLSSRLD